MGNNMFKRTAFYSYVILLLYSVLYSLIETHSCNTLIAIWLVLLLLERTLRDTDDLYVITAESLLFVLSRLYSETQKTCHKDIDFNLSY
jgi:hypothetical protein